MSRGQLGIGDNLQRIQKILEEGLGTSIEEEIVGKIDAEKVSDLINEIDKV